MRTKIAGLLLAFGLLAGTAAIVNRANATITSTNTKTTTALGNGVTTNYTIGFTFQANSEVRVYLQSEAATPYTRTELVYGAGAGKFTITGGDPGTTVVMGTAPSASQRLIIARVTSRKQTVNYVSTEAFPADDHEEQMDRMVQSIQEIDANTSAKIGLSPVSTASPIPTFPDPAPSAVVRYNGAGTDLEAVTNANLGLIYSDISGLTWAHILGVGATADRNVDFNNNQAKNLIFDNQTVAPSCSAGLQGKSYWNSTSKVFYICDGTSWLATIGTNTPDLSAVLANGSNAGLSGIDMNGNTISNAVVQLNGVAATRAVYADSAGQLQTEAQLAKSRGGTGYDLSTQALELPLIATPSSPAAGFGRLYEKVNKHLYFLDSTGAETDLFSIAPGSIGLNDAHILVGNGSSVAADVAVSGDLSLADTGAFTISNSAVSNAKMANMNAHTFKGNNTGSAAAPLDLTATQLTAEINAVVGDSGSGGTKGLVPAPSAGDAAAGKFLSASGAFAVPSAGTASSTNDSTDLSNAGIKTAVAGSALTISLVQADGTSNPAAGTGSVYVALRSSTATNGGYNVRSVTSALSMTVSSGSTLGTTASTSENLYVYALDNGGTVELAVSATNFGKSFIGTTTAEGGAGAADSFTGLYSTTARTNVPMRLLGVLENSQATPGTWAAVPTTTRIGFPPDNFAMAPGPQGQVICSGTVASAASGVVRADNSCATSTRTAAGRYTLTFRTGVFPNAPNCTYAPTQAGSPGHVCVGTAAPTTTTATVSCDNPGVGATDDGPSFICIGMRN
jgi:hypothetical protein